MRWLQGTVAVLLLCGAGLAQGGTDERPLFRCYYDGKTTDLPTVESSGDRWLDSRLKTERSFLATLFRTKPGFRLLGDGAPRDAFMARTPKGGRVICFKASWLLENTRRKKEHRAARVAYALAHQWAHALQAKRHCPLPERARELHADIMAGWYLGKRNLATIKGKGPLTKTFTEVLFAKEDAHLNTRFEHGDVAARAHAVATGFRLRRVDGLKFDAIYAKAIELCPVPRVGVVGGAPDLKRAGLLGRLLAKRECAHKGPCQHQIACTHPKPCTHKVACEHFDVCTHRVPCVHRIECRHRTRCVHRVDCEHKVQCVHTIPCTHRLHAHDYKHECDYDSRGNPVACVHRVPCCHFRHRFDYLHNFDYAHDFDYEHEYDKQHEFDMEHRDDPQHPKGDPRHAFDMAHEWDPIHKFDLAHLFDPLHDYDVVDPK